MMALNGIQAAALTVVASPGKEKQLNLFRQISKVLTSKTNSGIHIHNVISDN